MLKKRILIPMIEVGSGHKMPALSIRDALENMYPEQYQIDVVDFVKESGALKVDKFIKESWDYALDHPSATKYANAILNFLHPLTQSRLFVPAFFNEFVKKGIEYIHKYKPDIIFSTHFFCGTISSMAREKYRLPIKVIDYMTDPIIGHSWWVDNSLDYILVASENAKEYLVRQGALPDKIRIFPFPINRRFFDLSTDYKALKERYHIDESKFTVLISSGGQGIGNSCEYAKEIYKRELPFNLIAVCGKNETMKNELEELKRMVKSKTNLLIFGFINNMNELLSISDLSISKAGASSTFESLASGSPIIFTHWAGYNEKGNIDFCLQNRIGWYGSNKKSFFEIIDSILSSDILNEYKNNIKTISYLGDLKNSTEMIAKFIVQNIEQPLESYIVS
ncbi:MAG: hypothetical protein FIA99_13275 [Ruminiclostridium sp.]|nr:hypothetical protein [Ruminiclostridium sp.]